VEKVIVSLARGANGVRLSLELRSTERDAVQEPAGERSEFDFTLTEPVIAQLMKGMGGSYAVDSARRSFRLFFGQGG
jgi:hypothetical protein